MWENLWLTLSGLNPATVQWYLLQHTLWARAVCTRTALGTIRALATENPISPKLNWVRKRIYVCQGSYHNFKTICVSTAYDCQKFQRTADRRNLQECWLQDKKEIRHEIIHRKTPALNQVCAWLWLKSLCLKLRLLKCKPKRERLS